MTRSWFVMTFLIKEIYDNQFLNVFHTMLKELFSIEHGVIAKDKIGVWLVETWNCILALELNWQLKQVSALYSFALMHYILLILFYIIYFTEHFSDCVSMLAINQNVVLNFYFSTSESYWNLKCLHFPYLLEHIDIMCL